MHEPSDGREHRSRMRRTTKLRASPWLMRIPLLAACAGHREVPSSAPPEVVRVELPETVSLPDEPHASATTGAEAGATPEPFVAIREPQCKVDADCIPVGEVHPYICGVEREPEMMWPVDMLVRGTLDYNVPGTGCLCIQRQCAIRVNTCELLIGRKTPNWDLPVRRWCNGDKPGPRLNRGLDPPQETRPKGTGRSDAGSKR